MYLWKKGIYKLIYNFLFQSSNPEDLYAKLLLETHDILERLVLLFYIQQTLDLFFRFTFPIFMPPFRLPFKPHSSVWKPKSSFVFL